MREEYCVLECLGDRSVFDWVGVVAVEFDEVGTTLEELKCDVDVWAYEVDAGSLLPGEDGGDFGVHECYASEGGEVG